MTGRRATLDDGTECGIKKALNKLFVYLFIFIEGNAVSVINLNYIELQCKPFHEKLSKMVVEHAATSNSTQTTKIIPK